MEWLKEKFQKAVRTLKGMSISNYKLSKLQEEINQLDIKKKKPLKKEEDDLDLNLVKFDFEDLSSEIEKMMAEINKKNKIKWETIQTRHPTAATKPTPEMETETENHYWKKSLKLVVDHYLNNGNDRAILRFKKSPYCFRYPLLSRIFKKVKELN
ncbi:MAG: hypothetical protein R6U96_05765 [Promethearchaeia archaeon]